MKPTFFRTPSDFRKWLEQHHDSAAELWVGLHKKGSGKPSITWPESVDEALCFGWIDGVRKSIDEESYVIRFTPRRPRSIWSAVGEQESVELLPVASAVVPANGEPLGDEREEGGDAPPAPGGPHRRLGERATDRTAQSSGEVTTGRRPGNFFARVASRLLDPFL